VKIVIQNTSCDDLFEFEENCRELEAVKLLVQRVRGTRKSVKRDIECIFGYKRNLAD